MTILFGADRLVRERLLPGNLRRAGLVTNDAARLAGNYKTRSRTALLDAGVPIVRLFSPEHGLTANAADGAAVSDGVDAATGLPVVSLYGATMAPPATTLADLDVMLFDVPDVGARFYTYTWTLTHVMDACAAAGVPLYILDRPNPLGGLIEQAEGPLLEARHCSFVGRHTIPVRHSLTLGEIGLLWRAERCPEAEVSVIQCTGWQRRMLHHDDALPFVAPSPALNSFAACLFYPGLCFFEATNVSVGRGDPLSFSAVGAPWLNAAATAERFGVRGLAGVSVAVTSMVPQAGPHAATRIPAVQLTTTSPENVRPVTIGLALLADIIALHPRDFAWSTYPTTANPAGEGHFERLIGVSGIREQLTTAPESVDANVLRAWTAIPGWCARWQRVQLYD